MCIQHLRQTNKTNIAAGTKVSCEVGEFVPPPVYRNIVLLNSVAYCVVVFLNLILIIFVLLLLTLFISI